MLTHRILVLLPLTALGACEMAGDDPAPVGAGIEWLSPASDAEVPTGGVVELAVAISDPEARAVEFFVDGELVGTCDPSQPDEDCMRAGVWRWSFAFADEGAHELAATLESPAGTATVAREVVVLPEGQAEPRADELAVDEAIDPNGELTPDDGDELGLSAAARLNRGYLDPNRPRFHSIFGGVKWAVKRRRVRLRSGTPMGSVAAVNRCLKRFGGPIRRWADHFRISRASVVATAITESNCTNPAGSSDGLSSGPMQVTASTCSALTGLSRTTCRLRMHNRPGFSFKVGAMYMASSYQRSQHHQDPPKIAAAYNAGSLRATYTNRWHMISTGNHIDRFVWAYNAYRKWEALHGGPVLRAVDPAPAHWDGSVARVDALPASASEGTTVFVGDFARRDGSFYEMVDGAWASVDEEDPQDY